jgi:glutamate--cysteine ligase
VSKFKPEQASMLRAPFSPSAKPLAAVGVEVEAGVVDPVTGKSRPYTGKQGVGDLLRQAALQWGGTLHYEGENVIGFHRADGTDIGLESGCALEYASTPETSLVSLVQKVDRDFQDLAGIADNLDSALLSGAMLPFDTREDIHWAPKPRIPLMLKHFKREIGSTSQGPAAMAHIITVQTTLDFLDAEDLCRKHRMANVVSPLVGALFVNSPIQAGQLTNALSRRMQIWADVDYRRVGIFEHSINPEFSIDDLIAWATQLPMMYRIINGEIRPVPPHVSLESYLENGFGDGTYPSLDDWLAMLNTTWPYVRVRNTLELRIADGPFQQHWAAAPALWVGLAYDRQSCEAAWDLARGYSLKDYLDAVDDVAVRGLDASIDGHSIRAMCRDLLNIARDGLRRRVKDNLEPEAVLGYLDPLTDVIESGQTFAEQLSERWSNELACDPKRYVEAYRYR